MNRFVHPLLGSALIILFACSGPAESEAESTLQEAESAVVAAPAPAPSTECPWASDTDPTCAAGYSEKACGGGSGKCRVSGSRGCTCVTGTVVAEPVPVPAPEPVVNAVVVAPVEDKTTKECPWTSDTDPACAAGTSETSCGGGTGKCRVSGSRGCTCVSNSASTPEPVPGPVAP